MNGFVEMTVGDLRAVQGGKGKPIYWKDLSWKQQKCILSVGGALVAGSVGTFPGMLSAGAAAFWSECL